MNLHDPQHPSEPAEANRASEPLLIHGAHDLEDSGSPPTPDSVEIRPPVHEPPSVDPSSPLTGLDLLYLLVFYVIGGELLGLAVAIVATAIFGIPFAEMQNLSGPGASVAVVSQALLSFATLAFLYVLVRARTGAPFWPSVGWRKFPFGASFTKSAAMYVPFGFSLALLISFASAYVDNDKTLPMEELFRNRQTVVLLMLLGILVAPFIEETLFRGCLYPVLARRFGVATSVIVTGILFGAAHAAQLWGGWAQIGLLMCVGILLTYIRARAETVAASFLVHVTYNSTLFVMLLIGTGGLRHFPTT